MRRDSLLLLGLLSTICMIGGVVIGIQSGNAFGGPPQATPTPARASPAPTIAAPAANPVSNLQPTATAGQMALLVLGLSDKNAAQPKFEGAWIIAFSPGINKYYLLGFPREEKYQINGRGPQLSLADIYAQGAQQDLGYLFVRDAIQSVYGGISVQAVVTLDRADLANLSANVGGITVGEQVLMGAGLAAAYDTISLGGTAARMDFEDQALEALIQALAAQHWTPDSVAVYLEQQPRTVRPEDAAALTELARSAPALQNVELTWTVAGGAHDNEAAP
jgi:hypothetical protein